MEPSLAFQIATALGPLAQGVGGHHDWNGGWWILMVVGMVTFWALVIGGGIWLARELSANRRAREGHAEEPVPLEILDRRLAEGAISIEDYEQRRRTLLDAGGGTDG
jgi:putative membrane protein